MESARTTLLAKILLETIIASATPVSKETFVRISTSVPLPVVAIQMLNVRTVRETTRAPATKASMEMEKLARRVSVTIDGVLLVKNAFHQQVISVRAKKASLLIGIQTSV